MKKFVMHVPVQVDRIAEIEISVHMIDPHHKVTFEDGSVHYIPEDAAVPR